MIARVELAEALAAPGPVGEVPVDDPRDVMPKPSASKGRSPVAGSIVPRRREAATAQALAPDYRRIVDLLEAELFDGGEGLMAKELTARLGLEWVPAKIEGVRSKRSGWSSGAGWPPRRRGRFMPRVSSAPGAVS
ncbi:hypothetical protein [Streptomyces sp. NPDC059893]|uniref:hypothetical protein n=1 Tax=Streptomyces sp. NPDC059893 TaxID=3346990 RepID=UPI00365493B2